MRLGLSVGYSGSKMSLDMPLIEECERLGFHAVWSAEAYGSDAVTAATWIAAKTSKIHVGTAIMQMPARTPAMTAMTATTLDQLSGGRFLLGLGLSGPQVVEGWHGVSYRKPLTRTREYVEILRQVWDRQGPLQHEGALYQIPYRGDDATGLGKPLKSILHGRRIPIYLATIGRKSVVQTAEIADGWLPIFYSPTKADVWKESLDEGFSRRSADLAPLDIAASCIVIQGDDVPACLQVVKGMLALYVGGMGARGRNFYNDLACRYGYEEAARKVQDLYLDGKKKEAMEAVPDAFADEVSLCGPPERIRDRAQAWQESNVTMINCGLSQPEAARTLAEALL